MKFIFLIAILPLLFCQIRTFDEHNLITNVTQLFSGIFFSLGDWHTGLALLECHAIDTLFHEDATLMKEFFSERKGYLSIELAEEELLNIVGKCVMPVKQSLPQDLKNIYDVISSKGFPQDALNRIYNNFSDILVFISNATKQYEAGNHVEEGVNLGKILSIILGPLPNNTFTDNNKRLLSSINLDSEISETHEINLLTNLKKLGRFLVGFLNAFFNVPQSVPDLEVFLRTLRSVKNRTIEIIKEFEKGSVIQALADLTNLVNDTVISYTDAKKELYNTFSQFLTFAKSPFVHQYLRNRIKDNINDIVDNWNNGMDSLNNGTYFKAGGSFGKIPSTLWSGPKGKGTTYPRNFTENN